MKSNNPNPLNTHLDSSDQLKSEINEKIAPAEAISKIAGILNQIALDPYYASESKESLAEAIASLPITLKDSLFAEYYRQGEAVLSYKGKKTQGEILGDSRLSPLQVIKTLSGVNETDGWVNKLIFGDNLGVLKTLRKMKQEGLLKNADGTDGIRLVYIDPPFATEREFRDKEGTVAYSDKSSGAEFIEFVKERLVILKDLLASDGSIFVHLDEKKSHYIKIVLDEIFGPANFVNEIIWHYTGGGRSTNYFSKKHDTILWYKKNKQTLFNIDAIRVPYKESSGYAKGGIKAASGKVYMPNPKGTPVDDVWDIPIINPLSLERIGYPTQKPEELLGRIIEACSNPGDLVLDAFAGSGTTIAVAEKLGRRWIGIDCGKLSIYTIQKRLLNLRQEIGNKGELVALKTFQVVHAGLYDEQTLKSLPFEEWKSFVLALYGCRPDQSTIDGISFDGKRGSRGEERVIVFDWRHAEGEFIIDETYLQNIVTTLVPHYPSSKRSKHITISVIAPSSAAQLLVSDTLTDGNLTVRVLRVPSSMSNLALSGGFEGLSTLDQPTSDKHINSIIRSVGFDFIIPPTIRRNLSVNEEGFPVIGLEKLESFSQRGIKDEVPEDGRLDLSMILVDYEHLDFESGFDFEEIHYQEGIKSLGWLVKMRKEALNTPTAIIWIDKFGNELREIIQPDDWSVLTHD